MTVPVAHLDQVGGVKRSHCGRITDRWYALYRLYAAEWRLRGTHHPACSVHDLDVYAAVQRYRRRQEQTRRV